VRWRWIVLPVLLVLLVGAPLVALHRLLYTEAGLAFALTQLHRVPGARIEVEGARGTLAGPIAADRVVVEHEAARIELRGLRMDAALRPLLHGLLRLETLAADAVEVTLLEREPPPPSAPGFLPRFLEIEAPRVELRGVALTLLNGERIAVESIRAALDMSRWRIRLNDLVLEDAAGRIEGSLALRAMQPLGLRVAANGHWRLPDGRDYRFATALRGNLDRLGTTVALSEPANLSFVGNLLSLAEAPRAVGTVRAVDFDGSPWVEAGRFPAVSGSVAIDAGRESFGLDGTLTAPSLIEGLVRVQGAGRLRGDTLEIDELRAWRPASTLAVEVAGTVRTGGASPELDLRGEWRALRWPLDGEAAFESPLGRYTLRGALPYDFELQAHANVPGLPLSDFDTAGRVDRERLVLNRFDGRAFGGRITGGGRLDFTGRQAWSARLEGRDIDVAMLRPDLTGRVTFSAAIDGTGFTADAPWTLRLASLSGRVMGRALTGRGEIAHRGGEYELRGLRVANGESNARLDGRWGRRADLRWSADIRRLGLLHPDLEGELLSAGRLHGDPQRPEIEAEARVRRLVVAGIEVGELDIDVDLDLADRRPSRIGLQADALVAGPVQLEDLRFQLAGLTREHEFGLDFYSSGDGTDRVPRFRGRIAASGAYDVAAALWRGRLEEFSIRFPDGASTLVQPAAIVAGPGGVEAEIVCLATGEARLCVEGEWQAEPASWRVLYSVQDWPLRRLLRSMLGWREFDGKLQASGWAEQAPGRDWVGGTTVYVDDPVLDIPRNQFRSERIRLGSARLDAFADAEGLRAKVDADLFEGTVVRGEATARRERGRAVAELPLDGLLTLESASVTALAVLVPEIDRSSGRLDARVELGGTLGSPRFDGELHLADGEIAMYRSNLRLTDLRFDGRFKGDQLVFDGSGRTPRGGLEFNGRFAWPEDVMTGEMRLTGERLLVSDTPSFRILASPDLTLRAGPEGYEVTGEIQVPLARIRPRDLSTTVRTSVDERIVGLEVEDTGPSTLDRVVSRIRIVLGDDVRVDSFGLRARLGGDLTVFTRPNDVPRGDGAIRVLEGEYKAFGQFVRIVRGILSYDMTPLDEPTLDLVGERQIRGEDITVSINVRGTLASPFVTLSSDPPMPENEALSFLLTGRSINQLQSGEALALDRAAESLALSGGGLLLGGLGARVGLDEVALEQDAEDGASVVLGKYLTPKLFVSYGISIAEAINTIKLRYTLSERWSLKAEAGLEQSADVEFRIER
jgi:translocation and assembly module TamB